MSDQAILLVALAVTGSIRSGSSIVAALTLSAAIGGPLLGATLDRSRHPGRILSVALGLYAMAIGFFMPAISGGWSSRLKTFVNDERLARASAIDATTFNVAGLIGPGVADLM